MNILIFMQSHRGGTNVVLNCAQKWLIDHGHKVIEISQLDINSNNKFDLALLPTSEMHYLAASTKAFPNIKIERIIIWAMGSRAFHGAFFNQMKLKGLQKYIAIPMHAFATSMLESLLLSRSIVFTDEVGLFSDLEKNRNRAIIFEDLIYPVPIEVRLSAVNSRYPRSPQRVMWIGRIDCDFKVLPLLRVISDILNAVRNNILSPNVEFLIVGSGDGDELIQQAISNADNVKITWEKWVDIQKLDELLGNGVDILFAMGASALHGARMGIPTIIVQPFSHPSQETAEMYRWIHHTVGHSLGEFPWFHCQPEQPRHSLQELLGIGTLHENALNALEFSKKFDAAIVFERLFSRKLPSALSRKLQRQLHIYMYFYKLKYNCKIFLSWFKT